MLDLNKPHTVVVVTGICRLPFVTGRLGLGVHHFEGDMRKYVRSIYHKRQPAELYFVAGDTPTALKAIAALKQPDVDPAAYAVAAKAAGATPVEFEGDLSAMTDPSSHEPTVAEIEDRTDDIVNEAWAKTTESDGLADDGTDVSHLLNDNAHLNFKVEVESDEEPLVIEDSQDKA